jgi:hypothetical protein
MPSVHDPVGDPGLCQSVSPPHISGDASSNVGTGKDGFANQVSALIHRQVRLVAEESALLSTG